MLTGGHRCDCAHEEHVATGYLCQNETVIRKDGSFLCDPCKAHPPRPEVAKPVVDVSNVTGIWALACLVTDAIEAAHGPVVGPRLANRFLSEFIPHSGDTEFVVSLVERFVVTVDSP